MLPVTALSTATIEEIIAAHDAVAECAVIGLDDAMKGQIPIGFVVLKDGVTESPDTIIKELILNVRNKLGPIASFKKVMIAKRLPKTRSGKTLRKTMRNMANNKPYRIPSTIEDPVVLDEIKKLLELQKVKL